VYREGELACKNLLYGEVTRFYNRSKQYTGGETMPFEIVRSDIVNMRVDAIVNPADPMPQVGYGCDAGIHRKAGPNLLEVRKRIGALEVGQGAVTPGFDLPARHVIHMVGPVWEGGVRGETAVLRRCYDRALELAEENGCESVAFPLLSAGNLGFPEWLSMETAVSAFTAFLAEHEMHIYLVVFGGSAFTLSEKLFRSVESYIDDRYVERRMPTQYGLAPFDADALPEIQERRISEVCKRLRSMPDDVCAAPTAVEIRSDREGEEEAFSSLEDLLSRTDAGFSETLLRLIDRTGKKDSEIYKRANVDRKLFSKIRTNPYYRPSKTTALAFAVALELDLEETKDFIGRAGFALTRSSKLDIIVEYFIRNENYNIHEINMALFQFDQNLLGA